LRRCGKIPPATPVWCINGNPSRRCTVGDEREKAPRAADNEPDVEAHKAPRAADSEPDVEAHRRKLLTDDAPADETDDDDTPDVEAHRRKL